MDVSPRTAQRSAARRKKIISPKEILWGDESALVIMSSAIIAHQRRITGLSGKEFICWLRARVITANKQWFSGSPKIR
jgi:hypothetical protein